MNRTTYGTSAASSNSEKWYYMDGSKKCGPIDTSKLVSMLASGELTPDTRVWTQGMKNWSSASETDLVEQAHSQKQQPVVINMNGADAAPPKRKSRWWIWLIAGILIIGIGVAAFFLLSPKEEDKEAIDVPESAVLTYGLANPVIFENDDCAFMIDSIGEKGDYLELDVRCVNKTKSMLSFTWNSTSVNGGMFDPLWRVYVHGESTSKSSITFPLSTLDSLNLLPAEQIKFILSVYNEDLFNQQREESEKYIKPDTIMPNKRYKQIDGFDGYVFSNSVRTDRDGRPYYYNKDWTVVYFDEICDSDGRFLYSSASQISHSGNFYNDDFGRPYYFSKYGTTIYYDGYGFAFSDPTSGKNYFYDEAGNPAYYGNGGMPQYYEGSVPQEYIDAGKPKELVAAQSNYIVHEEFTIYPTGKSADEAVYPNRITAESEQIYWNGAKGNFIVLGGQQDEFTGYIVHTCIENNSDSYVYFGLSNVAVNGFDVDPDTITPLRPHSRIYRNIIIPMGTLEENDIEDVEQIDFRVYAVGENLSVPLYPISWEAVTINNIRK